jgi:hypothetical protein
MTIPIIHVDHESEQGLWSAPPASFWRAALTLVRAFNRQGEAAIRGAVPWWVFKKSVAALNMLLGGEFNREASELAEGTGVPVSDIITANIAYDIAQVGCSTFVEPTPDGPLHARNLDWPFPGGLLRKHLIVEQVHNARAGNYMAVTWPGLFGALTGIAPGRFSVTVNYVTHNKESSKAAFVKRAAQGYWPSTWVVRRALSDQPDFAAAVRYLKKVPVLSPVLFTVVGTRNTERVVIERSADLCAVRKPTANGALLVTNHYVSSRFKASNVDLDDGDSRKRFDALNAVCGKSALGAKAAGASALKILSSSELLDPASTQHQVVMLPRDGEMVVRVPGARALRVQMS